MNAVNTAVERKDSQAAQGDAQRVQRYPVYVPATDVFERENAIIITADMPGVREQDVEVDLDDDVLTLRGRTAGLEQEGYDVLFSEFGAREYERFFSLSADVNRDAIKATLKNGVLRLELPKAETAKPRKISVQAG